MTGWDDTEGRPAADEHQRFARYQQQLAHVRQKDETGLVSVILRDPDTAMAQSAVGLHLDRRAAQLLTSATFPDWARGMASVIAEREFLTLRLREWVLLNSISNGDAWTEEEVITASDWFQRKAAEVVTTSAVLPLLASRGRTRRVRTAASRRMAQQDR